MSKYIKLEDAIKEAKAWSMFGKDDLVSRLEKLPSIDVIFCKDCKRYVSDGGALMVCDITGNPVPENDYCSCGKRKEQEHEVERL